MEPDLVLGVHAFANTYQGISFVIDSAHTAFVTGGTHSSVAWQPGVLHKSHLNPGSLLHRRPSLGVQISPFSVMEGNFILFVNKISLIIISTMILF